METDEENGQTIIRGMGELHLDIIVDRLKREFGVEINQGQPQVNYKEALTAPVEHREVFKKQSGGRGKFADIVFQLGPADEGVPGLQFIDEVKGGNIPKEYIPRCRRALRLPWPTAARRVRRGQHEGDSPRRFVPPVDSDSLSFEIAARNAFRAAGVKAGRSSRSR